MSRFGLRSNSDIFRLSEEKASSRKLTASAKVALKRVHQKPRKSATLSNETQMSGHSSPRSTEEDKPQVSIVCSLPLNRLTGFIEKLQATETKVKSKTKHNDNAEKSLKQERERERDRDRDRDRVRQKDGKERGREKGSKQRDAEKSFKTPHKEEDLDEQSDRDPDEDEATLDNGDSQPLERQIVRILCLYCDKKFTSYKMQLKHVEKFHIQHKDRRCSGRNSQASTHAEARKQHGGGASSAAIASTSRHYPGCTFCKRTKAQQITASAKDLNGLFLHLTECHADKYFGCKVCVQRFPNTSKLSKHMQSVHKDMSYALCDGVKAKLSEGAMLPDKCAASVEKCKTAKVRVLKTQKSFQGANVSATPATALAAVDSSTIIGAEEPILSRLGLTQNRLPNNRKGVRLRRESIIPDALLKPEPQPVAVYTSPVKPRNKSGKSGSLTTGSCETEVVFRVPTRTDVLSCVFDDNFYREVVANVRNNLLYHLDGKLQAAASDVKQPAASSLLTKQSAPVIRSTLVETPVVLDGSNDGALDSEIHAATSLAATTAFPTLLTAEQYGGDTGVAKIRRPHTKNSWKWKWDSVKKFKLINEGGKIVKKMKQPMLGLRDLSKLDMWTQLTMRQKHEWLQHAAPASQSSLNPLSVSTVLCGLSDATREEKQRLNEQLNFILDMRLLPHIILEQNEQAIIKLENDEFGIAPQPQRGEEYGADDNILSQTFADEGFLSLLQLLPHDEQRFTRRQLVLSGEWARPRCYLCMCCGAKFEKLKSLEEHKMFRHSHILSTHYEVVGRELLAGNLLRHLFIPNRALSYYGREQHNNSSSLLRRLSGWHKDNSSSLMRRTTNMTPEDDSSDSIQSMLNSCTTNTYSVKHSTTNTDECDTDTKTTLDINTVSPSHSMQSSNSSFMTPMVKQTAKARDATHCTKCRRKCSGIMDLYRHMLDCSGDYIWALAKKRKYRYYCGSKKRRTCNKHNFAELRKSKQKSAKPSQISNDTEESASNCSKIKTPPRQRPSDAESIKKMLENLPPKRVCKKIFPALTKTKKSKLIAKHKIYNPQGRLRKTRARQISQAARLLSKTKGQFSSKAGKKKNRRVLQHRNKNGTALKKDRKEQQKIAQESKSAPQPTAASEASPKPSPLEKAKEHKPKSPKECSPPAVERKDAESETEASPKHPIEAISTAPAATNCAPEKTQPDATTTTPKELLPDSDVPVRRVCASLRSNKNGQQQQSAEPSKPPTDSVTAAAALSNVSPPSENANCNKKRSKKINDCIAMLTGKLEEKLKTEQHVTGRNELCAEVELGGGGADGKTKSPEEKKPPKRKALSRRIIKLDNVSAKLPVAAAKAPSAQPLPIVATICTPFTKEEQAPVLMGACGPAALALPPPLPPAVLPAAAAIVVAPQPPPPPPQQLPPPIPIPLNMLPKLPLYMPVEKFRATATAPLAAVQPLPIIAPAPAAPPPPPPAPLHTQPLAAPPAPAAAPPPPPLPLAVPVQSAVPTKVLPTPPAPLLTVLPTVQPMLQPPPPPPPVPTASANQLYSAEPLNLCSVKKFQKQNATQDLTCAPAYRSGMPARRQTICGFEARNFLIHDEMEPLDLSKKCTKELPAPMPMPDVLPVAPLTMTPVAPAAAATLKVIDPALMTAVAMPTNVSLPPDAVLNKQFYSNLDLLKIPQVRNPGYVPPPNEVINLNAKSPVKKRNSGKSVVQCNEVSVKPLAGSSACKKDTPAPKKDTGAVGKGKFVPKMDDEVINHIDDAINSVINAVKASFGDSEKEESAPAPAPAPAPFKPATQPAQELLLQPLLPLHPAPAPPPQPPTLLPVISLSAPLQSNEQTTKAVTHVPNAVTLVPDTVTNSSIGLTSTPLKSLTPQKRSVRAKTMDCRPAFLLTPEATVADNMPVAIAPSRTPPPQLSVAKADACIASTQIAIVKPIAEPVSSVTELQSSQRAPLELVAASNEPIAISEKPKELKGLRGVKAQAQTAEICDSPCKQQQLPSFNADQTVVAPPESVAEVANEPPIPKCASPPIDTTSHETSAQLISEEHSSNINNTSSGFHSSGQVECLVEAKKKQRRRRKNELAAIVADQLLESFKIDKTRRDNLKKLENLAYEKSEDLLLTGMLLMSSTKRNVNSSFQTVPPSSDTAASKSAETTKRPKQEQTAKAKAKAKSAVSATHNDVVEKAPVATAKRVETSSPPAPAVEKEKELEFRRGRRRPYRRKSKVLDNENISKLKSSLESFSIGIEKQLSELEAKNAHVFSASESKTRSAAAPKSTLLRPSILSATLEQPSAQKALANESKASESKTAVYSRDPRLNKNIHKEEKEPDVAVDAVRGVERAPAAGQRSLTEIGDMEEDNYLTEIAKNVNEKIMAAENEDFAFASDGFEIGGDLQDDSISKFSRPPTSMSVRSAPNFNDDRSNFGSICDENTNTEVMDMDLDDELSVYTSYSQDVGRGRTRRRRRRRSVLLTRRPKKHVSRRDSSAETFECTLCHKTFFTASSLAKHNMTLAHVSKVSAQEYLLSKSMQGNFGEHKQSPKFHSADSCPALPKEVPPETIGTAMAAPHHQQPDVLNNGEMKSMPLESNKDKDSYNVAPRLTLNPDERLFFECCNILKGTETPRLSSEDCNNGATYTYAYRDKSQPCATGVGVKSLRADAGAQRKQSTPERTSYKSLPPQNLQHTVQQHVFRDPPQVLQGGYNKVVTANTAHEHRLLSPNYSAVSQFSAVTNTTSRFKTKAAMKGYENTHIDLAVHQELETKSRTVCKLTELAEIALGTEKPNSPDYTSASNQQQDASNLKQLNTREYMTLSVAEQQKDCHPPPPLSRERPKNNAETQSSTSSKTIMHSSIIKAAVEEHNKAPCDKIVIPDRPFKNIGLEEKETITFQKPKTSVNLLTDDNSVSTASYSDRDDFDFGSLSCDDDSSVKTSNERIMKNNSDSSSSRATAKTFENKSLIMGRIFKNASTKAKAVVKVQSVGVQKDAPPKADLDQLFDELRGDGAAKSKSMESSTARKESVETAPSNYAAALAPALQKAERAPKESRKKRNNASVKGHKDISKLQTELGMSQEEIVKLIDEGQRKSKRRCATNRPKKLVEMWSSDEYEEFLSTKDIIALIEEKEKQEKRRKRKNSVNQSNASDHRDRDADSSVQLSDNKRKSVRSGSLGERKEKVATVTATATTTTTATAPAPPPAHTPTPTPTAREVERFEREPDNSASTASRAGRSAASTRAPEGRAKYTRSTAAAESAVIPKSSVSSSKINHNSTSNRLNNKKNNSTAPKAGREQASAVKLNCADGDAPTKAVAKGKELVERVHEHERERGRQRQRQREREKECSALPSDDANYAPDLKRNNHRTRSGRDQRKYGVPCREDANNLKAFNKESSAGEVSAKKHNVNNNNNNNNNQSYTKSKRKTQSNQSPPRRKRLAAEKLYYWSSSSDEDFGRINNSACEQEFDGGEQYQKHGWIVGDSHKKLVTLLAIAKGNKKVDNCGVKKNVCKRKS